MMADANLKDEHAIPTYGEDQINYENLDLEPKYNLKGKLAAASKVAPLKRSILR
jgi:hypothetical protein